MSSHQQILAATSVAIAAWLSSPAVAADSQADPQAGVESPVDLDAQRKEILAWLDARLDTQVLFTREHFKKVRADVSGMPAEQLRTWLDKTEQVRAEMDSPQWRRTRKWVKEFLAVQAVYSDEQIEALRNKAARMSPGELLALMETVKEEHRAFIEGNAASERRRRARLWAGQSAPAQQVIVLRVASGGRSLSTGDSPYYGIGQRSKSQPHHRARRYQVPPPLITSREVARIFVLRSLFGGRGYRWW